MTATTTRSGARALTRATTRAVPARGGGKITRTTLPGGLRILTEAMPGVRSASIGVWVPVGSRDETTAVAGASHFLEHLLFKGTTTRSALDIASAMDAVGGEFNAFTEKEHTCYYATVLDRDLPLAIELVTDVVLNATVTAQNVDVERSVVLEEIAMRDDDPTDLVHDEFASALFGDEPLGRPILGTVDSIAGLSRRQVAGYYHRRYRADGMVVSVAGNVDHAGVVRQVRKAFAGRLDGNAQPVPPRGGQVRSAPPVQPVKVIGDDTEQANVVLDLIRAELDDVADGAITEAEVERGKGQMRGGIVLGLEDSCARMTRIGKSEVAYGDVLGVDDLIHHVDSVTRQDVADVAAYLLHQPRCLTVVGPFDHHAFDGA